MSTTAEDGGEKEKGGHEPQERDEKTALKEEEKVENEEEAEDTIVILKMVVTDLSGKERSPQKIEKIEQEQRNLSKARGEVDKEQLEKIPEKKYRLFFREVVLMSRLEPHEVSIFLIFLFTLLSHASKNYNKIEHCSFLWCSTFPFGDNS